MPFHRPLIPVLFAFTGGILAAHAFLSLSQRIILPTCILIALFLLALPFMAQPYRITCLLIVFFLTGIVLDLVEHRPSQLLPFAEKRKKVTIEGTVLEPIRVMQEMARLKVRAHVLFSGDKTFLVNENLPVSVYNHPPHIRPGDKIRFPARLRPFKNFNNPGRYDYVTAMKLRGFSCAASVSDGRGIVRMGPGYLPFPRGAFERLQRPVRDFFKEKLAPQDSALFRALLLGERQGISPELREPFNKTGVGHILAVSGLHVGLVAWVAFFLIKGALSRSYTLALKVDIRKFAALLTCVPVVGYTCLAGFHVSSQRAMIMVLVFLWSLILGREKEVWSTLALAGLLILGLDPHALFSISFQLSFSAVIGILWLTPPILNRLPPSKEIPGGKRSIIHSMAAYFTGLVAVSLSAAVFLLPVISYYFHRISLVTIPANITVVPLLGFWVIPLGLLSALVLPLSSQVADFLLHSAAWGLHGMMEMIHFWSGLPWSSFWVIRPNLFEILMFYALIFFIFFLKGRPWARFGVSALILVILGDIA
ncbi:MAG: ComEC family competence protein, partial [Deltaproteobacteria bacterium]|nr:ComEC family competence protein [Deltaproteobacteria bacterium]